MIFFSLTRLCILLGGNNKEKSMKINTRDTNILWLHDQSQHWCQDGTWITHFLSFLKFRNQTFQIPKGIVYVCTVEKTNPPSSRPLFPVLLPAVLTIERSLGGALAPPKSLQISHLDRRDVTSDRRTKATSTTLLVGKSRDMSPSIHNYVTDIFLRPLPKDVSILLSCSSWRNPVVEHIKRSLVCCQMQKCHARIT